MEELRLEEYFDKKLVLKRFKDLEELKKILDNDLSKFDLKVKDLCNKSYYDNDFQDYEVLVEVGNEEESIFDLTLYYAVTRIEENIIVETSFELI